MSKRVRSPAPLDDDERHILTTIAAEIRAHALDGVPMPAWLAAARSEQLRRIAAGDVRRTLTEALLRERAVALSYAIRRALAPPKASYKTARGEVAAFYGVADAVVSKNHADHKDYVKAWLAKMPSNLEYRGLSREEMLKREMASIEEALPSNKPVR